MTYDHVFQDGGKVFAADLNTLAGEVNGKLTKAVADATYANVDAYVIFRDQDGDELPEGSVVEIRVNTATSEIDDIIYTAPEA